MTQAEIDAEMTAAVPADSLRALREYAAAAQEIVDGGAHAGDIEIVAKSLA